jgi:osmotically inducible lipoprotein OsmB
MERFKDMLTVLLFLSVLYGCAGMTPTEQRMLSGGAIGAAGGAAIGAATGGSAAAGAAIGGAAGVVGGVVVDQYEKSQGRY